MASPNTPFRSIRALRPPTLPVPADGINPIAVSGTSYVPNPPHWKKAAEALDCAHFDEVHRMISQFSSLSSVKIEGTTLTVAAVADGLCRARCGIRAVPRRPQRRLGRRKYRTWHQHVRRNHRLRRHIPSRHQKDRPSALAEMYLQMLSRTAHLFWEAAT